MKLSIALLATLATLSSAQTVVKGFGRNLSEYTSIWGSPKKDGEGFLETQEKIWNVSSGVMGASFEVHVFFKAGSSVEERWLRSGSSPWEKEELWKVLDGKGSTFEMLHKGTPLLAPFHVLQAPNSLINFVLPNGEMAAQLQNSQKGPVIRIVSRSWAQTLVDMGLANVNTSAGRASSTVQYSSQPPAWGGYTLDALLKNLRELPKTASTRNFQPRNGRGTLAITRTAQGTRLELFIPDASATKDAEQALRESKGQAATTALPPVRAALEESFRKVHLLANQAIPGLIANPEWSAPRVKGTFTDENIQDLVSFGKMPARFSLLSWRDPSGNWDLELAPDGWHLTLFWTTAP